MAIDTAQKRRAAVSTGGLTVAQYLPSGGLSTAARRGQVAFTYADAGTPPTPTPAVTRRSSRVSRVRRSKRRR